MSKYGYDFFEIGYPNDDNLHQKEVRNMRGKLWFKLGAPIIALSLVAACGTGTNKAPVKEQAPVNEQAPVDERAPLDHNGNNNGAPVEDNLNNNNIPQDDLNGTNKDNR